VYRANPNAPTQAVAEAFDVTHRTGTAYVRHARDAGLLPPVERKGGGER
jgi:transposase